MKWLIIVGIIIVLIIPITRCALFNIPLELYYVPKDIFMYFKQKKYNLYGKTGQLVAYTGLFGKGKTLSMVHTVIAIYNKYNDKIVWSRSLKQFVPQKIKIFSNVALNIPYIELISLEQIVNDCESKSDYDRENETQTISFFLIDEASSQLFCRDYKDNVPTPFLNSLLTCRHYMMSLFYTTQRFKQVDKVLRDVTQAVIDCDKIWRFQRQYLYDAFDLEHASDITKVKPHRSACWFVRNSDYDSYDTMAVVKNLVKSYKAGNMMSDDEILGLIGDDTTNDDAVRNPSRALRKQRR